MQKNDRSDTIDDVEMRGHKMEEITGKQLEMELQQREPVIAVFIHTPLCGTCKVAKKMVEVASASVPYLPVYSININQSPTFAQKWKVESVPGLFLYQKGLNVERIYAFHSVSSIHTLFKKYAALRKAQQLEGDNY